MTKYLAGIITYERNDVAEQGWYYRLQVTFSPEDMKKIPVRAIARLQQQYRHELDVSSSPEGVSELAIRVVAHGCESAMKHAEDLGAAILRFCGLPMNILPV